MQAPAVRLGPFSKTGPRTRCSATASFGDPQLEGVENTWFSDAEICSCRGACAGWHTRTTVQVGATAPFPGTTKENHRVPKETADTFGSYEYYHGTALPLKWRTWGRRRCDSLATTEDLTQSEVTTQCRTSILIAIYTYNSLFGMQCTKSALRTVLLLRVHRLCCTASALWEFLILKTHLASAVRDGAQDRISMTSGTSHDS